MCGIFGLIFYDPQKAKKHKLQIVRFMNTLAVRNVERGTDATGISMVKQNRSVLSFRHTSNAYRVIRKPEWASVLAAVDKSTTMVLGHTRAGTHGGNTKDNAHPFTFLTAQGVLVGTHNGIIYDHKSYKPEEPFENDSRNLFWKLARTNEADLGAFLADISGGFALAFAVNGVAYLTRNTINPCYTVVIPEIGAVGYSSIPESLMYGAAIANLTIGKVKIIPAGTLLRFSLGRKTPVAIPYGTDPAPVDRSTGITKFVKDPSNQVVGGGGVQFVPGLVGYEVLREFTNVHSTISCRQCHKRSEESVLRLINDAAICTFCWVKRLEAHERALCPTCGSLGVVPFDRKTVCDNCFETAMTIGEGVT